MYSVGKRQWLERLECQLEGRYDKRVRRNGDRESLSRRCKSVDGWQMEQGVFGGQEAYTHCEAEGQFASSPVRRRTRHRNDAGVEEEEAGGRRLLDVRICG